MKSHVDIMDSKDTFPSDSILKHDRSASDMAENFLRIIDDFSVCH
mgnify:CR=1 FL=1